MNTNAGSWDRGEIEANLEAYVGREAVYKEHLVMHVRITGAYVEDGMVNVQAEVLAGPWGDEGITLPEIHVSTPVENSYFDRWVWVQPNVPWKLYFDPALVARVRQVVVESPPDTEPRALLRTLHRELFSWRPSEDLDEESGGDGAEQAAFEAYVGHKANKLVEKGIDEYRASDALGMPSSSRDPRELESVLHACKQIVEGRGFAVDRPIGGLDVAASHALIATMHFELEQQSAVAVEGAFLDTLVCRHRMLPGHRGALYVRVPRTDDDESGL